MTGRPSAALDERVLKTVLFTDIVSSTELLSARGDAQWRRQLDAHDKVVDWVLEKHGGRRAKHTGDGIFALFDGPTKAARAALELAPTLASRGINIRAGIHVGECERRGDEWNGMAVHIGARIGAMAGPDKCSRLARCAIFRRGRGYALKAWVSVSSRDLAEETGFSRHDANRRCLLVQAAQHFPCIGPN